MRRFININGTWLNVDNVLLVQTEEDELGKLSASVWFGGFDFAIFHERDAEKLIEWLKGRKT